MSKKYRTYPEEFKLSVIRDYYSSGVSRYACAKKHGIASLLLRKWLLKYAGEKKSVPLSPEATSEEMANRSKESYREEIARLRRRNKELEKALEFSRMEAEARDLLITRAEELFDIPIRKNLGPNSHGTGP